MPAPYPTACIARRLPSPIAYCAYTLTRMHSCALVQEGATLQQYAKWAVAPPALETRTLRLPRHLASRMCDTWPFMEEAFWRRVWPAARVAAEVAAVKGLKLGQVCAVEGCRALRRVAHMPPPRQCTKCASGGRLCRV